MRHVSNWWCQPFSKVREEELLGRFGVMVGNRDRSGVAAVDVRGGGEMGATVGHVLRASNDGTAQLAPGSIASLSTRSDPPPKHIDSNPSQARDTRREKSAR